MCAVVMTFRVGKFLPTILLAYYHHRQLENWQHWLPVSLTRRKPHRIINEERDDAKVKCIHRVLTVASRGKKNANIQAVPPFFLYEFYINRKTYIWQIKKNLSSFSQRPSASGSDFTGKFGPYVSLDPASFCTRGYILASCKSVFSFFD